MIQLINLSPFLILNHWSQLIQLPSSLGTADRERNPAAFLGLITCSGDSARTQINDVLDVVSFAISASVSPLMLPIPSPGWLSANVFRGFSISVTAITTFMPPRGGEERKEKSRVGNPNEERQF